MNMFLTILQHESRSVGGHYRGQSVDIVFAVKDSAAHVALGTSFPVLKSGLHQVAQLREESWRLRQLVKDQMPNSFQCVASVEMSSFRIQQKMLFAVKK